MPSAAFSAMLSNSCLSLAGMALSLPRRSSRVGAIYTHDERRRGNTHHAASGPALTKLNDFEVVHLQRFRAAARPSLHTEHGVHGFQTGKRDVLRRADGPVRAVMEVRRDRGGRGHAVEVEPGAVPGIRDGR